MAEEVRVPYVQRCLPEDGSGVPGERGVTGMTLHHLLFHPIAGDSAAHEQQSHWPPLLVPRGLQFGILDEPSPPRAHESGGLASATIASLAVANVTNPSSTETPGSLSDQRMGASPNHSGLCHTCRQQHHNCPGHFGRIALPCASWSRRTGPTSWVHPVINPLFVSLLVTVLQGCCMNCNRLRLSPHYVVQ
jgi:hypothetical protein